MPIQIRRRVVAALLLTLTTVACAAPTQPRQSDTASGGETDSCRSGYTVGNGRC